MKDMTITTENSNIDKEALNKVFGFTNDEADLFLSLSVEDQIKFDFNRISMMDAFASKIAKTVIENNFTKLSAKQADIINQKSIFIYNPVFSAADHYAMDIQAENAKFRQSGSSLR